jgi:hypothetical protein
METLERLRGSLLEALNTAPIGFDPIQTIRRRAIIAAGFTAAVQEAEKQRILVPSALQANSSTA